MLQNHKGTEIIECLFGCELCNLCFLKLGTDWLDIYVNYVCDLPPNDWLKMTVHVSFIKNYHSAINCFSNVRWIFPEFQMNSYETFQVLCSLCHCFFGVSAEPLFLGDCLCKFYLSDFKNWLSSTFHFPQNLIFRVLCFTEKRSNLFDRCSLLKFMKYLCRIEL